MAIDLKLEEVSKLRQAGVSPALIRQYQLGQLNPITGMDSYIRNILRGPTVGLPNTYGGPLGGATPFNPGASSALAFKPNRSFAGSNYGYDTAANRGAAGARSFQPTNPVTNTTGSYIDKSPGANPLSADADRQRNDEALDRVWPGRQAEIDLNNLNNQAAPTPPQFPGDLGTPPPPPTYPDLQIPDLVLHDYLQQAQAQYAQAYAPLYQALDLGKQNARDQQSRSDQVIEGLYTGLANDVKATGQTTAQQYQQSGADAQARSQALSDKLAQIYGNSAQDQATAGAAIGQAPAAAEANARSDTERQFQQAEAAKTGAAQVDSYAQGGQAAQTYSGQVANAAQTEGAGRRSDLIAQLANVLTGYDQQSLGYKNQEALGAINQSNTLSQQDLSMQENNIQTLLAKAGITDNRINAQYGAQRNSYTDKYQAAKDQFEAQRMTYQDQMNARQSEQARLAAERKAAQDALQQRIDNSFKSREVATGEQNAATAAGKAAGGAGGLNLDIYGNPTTGSGAAELKGDPKINVSNQVNAATHGNPGASLDEYYAFVHGLQYGDPNDPFLPTAALGGTAQPGDNTMRYDLNTFVNAALQAAQGKPNFKPEGIIAAATAYYNSLHN